MFRFQLKRADLFQKSLSECWFPVLSHLYEILFLGPVHMIPGQLITPRQLTDPRVNFASVHGLTPVTVHMSFSLPWGNFERRVTRCTTPGNPPCRGNFSPCEQNAKVAPGQEYSCACSLLMFRINFPIKCSRKHQK